MFEPFVNRRDTLSRTSSDKFGSQNTDVVSQKGSPKGRKHFSTTSFKGTRIRNSLGRIPNSPIMSTSSGHRASLPMTKIHAPTSSSTRATTTHMPIIHPFTSAGTKTTTPIPIPTAPPGNRPMHSDEDFNIRFVNLVRAHKCIYDKKVPEYRNRDNQEKAWMLISQETQESVMHCKERWRNLRACLSRYIKQQSSSDPQHKPYYLTEHMSFLFPFLKSTRSPTESRQSTSLSDSLSFLQQFAMAHSTNLTGQPHFAGGHKHEQQIHPEMEIKQSLSENDEETIDAFDPAIRGASSPPLSEDTASAITLQNFIPDVQLDELSPAVQVRSCVDDPSFHAAASSQAAAQPQSTNVNGNVSTGACTDEYSPETIKRIKTEVTTSGQLNLFSEDNSDMEFFRSIMPDVAMLTPQQKRKFKIGVLQLIDDVVDRYPQQHSDSPIHNGRHRQNSMRDWRHH